LPSVILDVDFFYSHGVMLVFISASENAAHQNGCR
jgi:hypothetical protein